MIIYASILVIVILIDMFRLWSELFTHGTRKGNSGPSLFVSNGIDLIEHGQGVPQIKFFYMNKWAGHPRRAVFMFNHAQRANLHI